MSKRIFKALRAFPWAPLICFGLAGLLMRTEMMEQLAWRSLDWRTQLRVYFQKPADPRINIILFEDSTEMNMVAWPPDRAYHGQLTALLALAKPAVLTWDVILDASREGDGDMVMAQGVEGAFQSGTRVITAAVTSADPVETQAAAPGPTQPLTQIVGDVQQIFGDEYAVEPFPLLRAIGLFGFVDAPRGADGIVRELPLVVRVGKQVFPSLSLQTVMAFYHVEAKDVRVVLGDGVYLPTPKGILRVPISSTGMYFVNYRYDQSVRFSPGDNNGAGGSDMRLDYPTESYGGVMIKLYNHFVKPTPGSPPPPDYQGKIILVGQNVTGKADAGPTPLSASSPLVLMHANAVNNMLDHDFARRVPGWIIWTVMILLGYLGVYTAVRGSLVMMITYGALVVVAYTNVAFWGWVGWSLWFPWVGPLIGFVSLEFIIAGRRVWQEQQAKLAIKGMFGSYVSPTVVDRLVNAADPPQLGGIETEITAYFSDIQSFSSFSEKLSPAGLVELMNEYLTACTDIIQEEGGTLDKYIGDAVVAMFGAPIADPAHALRACVATQRVQMRLDELRENWRLAGDRWPDVVKCMRSRIGLNTGRAIVGNMGSRTRFNYTMMGDDVNLGARMESGAKSWGVYTMCTGPTRDACELHGPGQLVFRPLGRIVVKGRAHPTQIFEIAGLKAQVTDRTHECIGIFREALDCYYARDWQGALDRLQRSAALEANQPGVSAGVVTNPSLVYQKIIAHYAAEPPPKDWDGVYVMSEK